MTVMKSDDKQLNFDFFTGDKYGLLEIENNEFLRVNYSGMDYKLLYVYDDIQEATKVLSKFTEPNLFKVEKIPDELLLIDSIERAERIARCYAK